MESKKLNDWLQLIAMFGVIISLIFVGFELRQSREIAISQTYQSRAASEVDAALQSAANPEFRSASSKHYAGAVDELTDDEYFALDYHFGALLTLWENDHFQYQNGYLSDEHWDKTLWNMKCRLGSPFYRKHLSDGGWALRESFREVVNSISAESESDPLNCWGSE